MPVRSRSILSRRTLLRSSAAAGGLLLGSPAIVTRAQAPAGRALWRAGRRRGRRPGDRLEPGRPGQPDAGALVDHREHGRDRRGRERRRARRSRLRGQGRSRRPACGAARVLRGELPRPGRPQDHQRARARQLRHAAGRAAQPALRLVGRHGRAGLGDQPGPRRHAHLRDHAAGRARLLHPFGRHDLRRRAGLRRGQDPGRQDLARRRRQALAQPRPSRRSRRWPRPCASSG